MLPAPHPALPEQCWCHHAPCTSPCMARAVLVPLCGALHLILHCPSSAGATVLPAPHPALPEQCWCHRAPCTSPCTARAVLVPPCSALHLTLLLTCHSLPLRQSHKIKVVQGHKQKQFKHYDSEGQCSLQTVSPRTGVCLSPGKGVWICLGDIFPQRPAATAVGDRIAPLFTSPSSAPFLWHQHTQTLMISLSPSQFY